MMIGYIIAKTAETAVKLVEYLENNRKKSENYLRGDKWTRKQIKDMEKKEPKRDKKGRFEKKADKPKVEVKFEVERPEGMSTEEYIKQLEKERDAFKLTAERMSGKYLDKCSEIKIVECERDSFKRAFYRMSDYAHTWKKRALKNEDRRLYAMDALRLACIHLGWFYHKLSWWTKRWNHEKILSMEMDLDRMVARAEGLDKE